MYKITLLLLCISVSFAWEGGSYDYPAHIKGTNLFIGNVNAALNCPLLRENGITSIIDLYGGGCECDGIARHKMSIYDTLSQPLFPLAEQIRRYVGTKSDKILHLIHCQAGISRSASVIAYIMMKDYNRSLDDAIEEIKSVRDVIQPNAGFMDQLRAAEVWINYCAFHLSYFCREFENPWKILDELQDCKLSFFRSFLGSYDDECPPIETVITLLARRTTYSFFDILVQFMGESYRNRIKLWQVTGPWDFPKFIGTHGAADESRWWLQIPVLCNNNCEYLFSAKDSCVEFEQLCLLVLQKLNDPRASFVAAKLRNAAQDRKKEEL